MSIFGKFTFDEDGYDHEWQRRELITTKNNEIVNIKHRISYIVHRTVQTTNTYSYFKMYENENDHMKSVFKLYVCVCVCKINWILCFS